MRDIWVSQSVSWNYSKRHNDLKKCKRYRLIFKILFNYLLNVPLIFERPDYLLSNSLNFSNNDADKAKLYTKLWISPCFAILCNRDIIHRKLSIAFTFSQLSNIQCSSRLDITCIKTWLDITCIKTWLKREKNL